MYIYSADKSEGTRLPLWLMSPDRLYLMDVSETSLFGELRGQRLNVQRFSEMGNRD